MRTQKFKATAVQSGSRVYLPLPFDPNVVWGEKTRHDITGVINGCPVRGPLEAGDAGYRLVLGAAWRRDNGVAAGETVTVELSPEGPQLDRLPPDVAAALRAEPPALQFFEGLPTFYRKNYLRWIESAKRPETRARRIAEAVVQLKAGQRR